MERIDTQWNRGQSIVPKENRKERDTGMSILDVYICVCNDGTMSLFKKRRVFDITYSMWVDVYEGLDSNRLLAKLTI